MEEKVKIDRIEKDKRRFNGGYRTNSGRKSVAKLKKQFNAREDLYWWIDAHWKKLTDYLEKRLEAGDNEMVKYLIDQRIGKAQQAVSLDVNATVNIEAIQTDIKNLLYGDRVTENTEPSKNLLQERDGKANAIDGIAVQDIPTDSPTEASESMAECSYKIREVLNSSPSSSNEGK